MEHFDSVWPLDGLYSQYQASCEHSYSSNQFVKRGRPQAPYISQKTKNIAMSVFFFHFSTALLKKQIFHGDTKGKSQRITKVIRLHLLGTTTTCTKPSRSSY